MALDVEETKLRHFQKGSEGTMRGHERWDWGRYWRRRRSSESTNLGQQWFGWDDCDQAISFMRLILWERSRLVNVPYGLKNAESVTGGLAVRGFKQVLGELHFTWCFTLSPNTWAILNQTSSWAPSIHNSHLYIWIIKGLWCRCNLKGRYDFILAFHSTHSLKA